MPEGSLIFPTDEFARRITALQQSMATTGLSALLLTSQADIFYATGFLTRFWESPARPWFVIVPATGKPVAVIPSIGVALMSRTWLTEIHSWDAPDPDDDGVSLLTTILGDIVPETGLIGLPMGLETHIRMPLRDYNRLTERLAPRRFEDATACVQRVREIKSEAEVAKIRHIGHIASAAYDDVPDLLRARPPLDQLFRDFQVALLKAGADWVSYVAGASGKGGYGDVISPAAAVPVQDGDVVMLDTGAVKDGYFCDFDRNFAIGFADPAAQKAHAALYIATDTALRQLRPGLRARDAHAILAEALRAAGARPCDGRLGHGLGVTLTEWPSLTPKDNTELRRNMVLTLEPSVEIAPGRIMVHEENIVLRDSGPELLAPRTSPELPVIP